MEGCLVLEIKHEPDQPNFPCEKKGHGLIHFFQDNISLRGVGSSTIGSRLSQNLAGT